VDPDSRQDRNPIDDFVVAFDGGLDLGGLKTDPAHLQCAVEGTQ